MPVYSLALENRCLYAALSILTTIREEAEIGAIILYEARRQGFVNALLAEPALYGYPCRETAIFAGFSAVLKDFNGFHSIFLKGGLTVFEPLEYHAPA
jgi:hypothetical protein